MVSIDYHPDFKKAFQKFDKSVKKRLKKLFIKIINNPEIGKPMRYERKNTRELYVKPFRLSYAYLKEENKIVILDLYHKKKQ